MKSTQQDARGFVEGVMTQLKKTGKSVAVTPRVQALLFKMTAGARKERQAVVESAIKLTNEEERNIGKILSVVSGHDVALDCRIDPDLIGGFRIQMADWVMDASMKKELSDMAHLIGQE
jgi:F-type H+-transporting ATPase subunit delta